LTKNKGTDKRFLLQELIAHYLYQVRENLLKKNPCYLEHPHRLTCIFGRNGCPAMAMVDKTLSPKQTGFFVDSKQFHTICELVVAALEDGIPVDMMSYGGGENIPSNFVNVAYFDFDLKLTLPFYTDNKAFMDADDWVARMFGVFRRTLDDFVPTEQTEETTHVAWRQQFRCLVTVPSALRYYNNDEGEVWIKSGAHFRFFHDFDTGQGGPYFSTTQTMLAFHHHFVNALEKEYPGTKHGIDWRNAGCPQTMLAFHHHFVNALEKEYPGTKHGIDWRNAGCDVAPIKTGVLKIIGAQKQQEKKRIVACPTCFEHLATEYTKNLHGSKKKKTMLQQLLDAQDSPHLWGCSCANKTPDDLVPVRHHVYACFGATGQSLPEELGLCRSPSGHPTVRALTCYDVYVPQSRRHLKDKPGVLFLENRLNIQPDTCKINDDTDACGTRKQTRTKLCPKERVKGKAIQFSDEEQRKLTEAIATAFPWLNGGDQKDGDLRIAGVQEFGRSHQVRLCGKHIKQCRWKAIREKKTGVVAHSTNTTRVEIKNGMMYVKCWNEECKKYQRNCKYTPMDCQAILLRRIATLFNKDSPVSPFIRVVGTHAPISTIHRPKKKAKKRKKAPDDSAAFKRLFESPYG